MTYEAWIVEAKVGKVWEPVTTYETPWPVLFATEEDAESMTRVYLPLMVRARVRRVNVSVEVVK